MKNTPTFARGDLVIVRGVWGLFRIAELRLVTAEAVVVRGNLRRIVPTDHLRPAGKEGDKK